MTERPTVGDIDTTIQYHDAQGKYFIHRWHEQPEGHTKDWYFQMFNYHVGEQGRLINERESAKRTKGQDMADIDTLEGLALNSAVAEALGLRPFRYGPHTVFELAFDDYRFSKLGLHLFEKSNDREVFIAAIPDYAHDLNAALALVADRRYVHEHFPEGLPHNDWYTDRVSLRWLSTITGTGEATNAATAFCRAFLHDRAARENEDGG